MVDSASAPSSPASASSFSRRPHSPFWRERRYRDEAQAQVGPVLTPAETAQRLGVSAVTVNKWRRQDKLLGLRFDDHQYLYPLFQFADAPLAGERGVLRHLDGVLHALGERTAWEKALFLLAAHPRLGGKTPVEVLRENPSPDVLDRLYLLTQHAGEMGTQGWHGVRNNHQRVRRQARPGLYSSSRSIPARCATV
jgi:hypothetical protein